MLEILQFYVSGFWVWLGITYGLCVIAWCFAIIMDAVGKTVKSARIAKQEQGDMYPK
tara:strand:+ start:2706 stop:2876 length:171 start_codon:yes stop_codon:yes gene_type:complete